MASTNGLPPVQFGGGGGGDDDDDEDGWMRCTDDRSIFLSAEQTDTAAVVVEKERYTKLRNKSPHGDALSELKTIDEAGNG